MGEETQPGRAPVGKSTRGEETQPGRAGIGAQCLDPAMGTSQESTLHPFLFSHASLGVCCLSCHRPLMRPPLPAFEGSALRRDTPSLRLGSGGSCGTHGLRGRRVEGFRLRLGSGGSCGAHCSFPSSSGSFPWVEGKEAAHLGAMELTGQGVHSSAASLLQRKGQGAVAEEPQQRQKRLQGPEGNALLNCDCQTKAPYECPVQTPWHCCAPCSRVLRSTRSTGAWCLVHRTPGA